MGKACHVSTMETATVLWAEGVCNREQASSLGQSPSLCNRRTQSSLKAFTVDKPSRIKTASRTRSFKTRIASKEINADGRRSALARQSGRTILQEAPMGRRRSWQDSRHDDGSQDGECHGVSLHHSGTSNGGKQRMRQECDELMEARSLRIVSQFRFELRHCPAIRQIIAAQRSRSSWPCTFQHWTVQC